MYIVKGRMEDINSIHNSIFIEKYIYVAEYVSSYNAEISKSCIASLMASSTLSGTGALSGTPTLFRISCRLARFTSAGLILPKEVHIKEQKT